MSACLACQAASAHGAQKHARRPPPTVAAAQHKVDEHAVPGRGRGAAALCEHLHAHAARGAQEPARGAGGRAGKSTTLRLRCWHGAPVTQALVAPATPPGLQAGSLGRRGVDGGAQAGAGPVSSVPPRLGALGRCWRRRLRGQRRTGSKQRQGRTPRGQRRRLLRLSRWLLGVGASSSGGGGGSATVAAPAYSSDGWAHNRWQRAAPLPASLHRRPAGLREAAWRRTTSGGCAKGPPRANRPAGRHLSGHGGTMAGLEPVPAVGGGGGGGG